MSRPEISLLAFSLMEYDRRNWEMPDVHVRIYEWFAQTEGARRRVLRVFRGCGKSTILGVRNSHKYHQDPEHQILAQGADDDLTDDLSRDTISILRAHPLTDGLLAEPAGVRHWFTHQGEAANARTPQYRGRGILSRVTGNRANEIQNDDVETEKNISDEKARKKLRKKLAEQTHILTPGGSRLWVGTPHCIDNIYDQQIKEGAVHLTIPLFASLVSYAPNSERRVMPIDAPVLSDGVWVFVGIGAHAQLLTAGLDYAVKDGAVHLLKGYDAQIDVCTGNAWPERFHRAEMLERRRECATFGEFSSQYQLMAKPIADMRLDPDRMIPYDVQPVIATANKETMLMLGKVRIVGASCRWDCATGKINADASALSLVLTDARGNLYWQFAIDVGEGTDGDLDKQCDVIRGLVMKYHIPRITVETNGVGGFASAILRKHLAGQGKPGVTLPALVCAVVSEHATVNKQKRILDSFEGPLSTGFLWAHVSVINGPAFGQMRDFDPSQTDQPDDYIDSGAGAVAETPIRIGKVGEASGILAGVARDNWRPQAGSFEVITE